MWSVGDHKEVGWVSDPQMWTVIGILGALVFALHRLMLREMSSRIDALQGVMEAKFQTVDHRLTAVETDLTIIKSSLINQRSA